MRPKRWLVLTIEIPSAELTGLFAEGILAFGARACEERDGCLITYLPAPDVVEMPGTAENENENENDNVTATELLVGEISRALARINAGVAPLIRSEWQAERDWLAEWKTGLAARRVGKRLVITPGWITPDAAPDDMVITIDPQMAFGTGEHASTRGALRLLETAVTPGARVLDAGTGSAVLAIAAAKLGAGFVCAVDADADALINAEENTARNEVADVIQLEHKLVDSDYLAAVGKFDIITANILSGVIVPLLPAFLQALNTGGSLIAAGILQTESAAFSASANAAGFRVLAEDREDEWWSGLLTSTVAADRAGR